MKLHELRPAKGSKPKQKRRVGRGVGSGQGKTAGRGTKGQKGREQVANWFEGGQTPLHRRLPMKRGFRNHAATVYEIINLDDLDGFKKGDAVGPDELRAAGVIRKGKNGLKVLGFGEVEKALKVSAHKFSKTAKEKIEKAGGEAIQL